jgi:hypothetical protein
MKQERYARFLDGMEERINEALKNLSRVLQVKTNRLSRRTKWMVLVAFVSAGILICVQLFINALK